MIIKSAVGQLVVDWWVARPAAPHAPKTNPQMLKAITLPPKIPMHIHKVLSAPRLECVIRCRTQALIRRTSDLMGKVVIVGAGIIGLYTALLISERGMGPDVTVVAKDMPGDLSIDYTSPIAGAHFSVLFGAGDPRMTRFCRLSYQMLKKLFKKFANHLEEAGLGRLPQIQFFDKPKTPEEIKSFEYAENFETITDKDELALRSSKYGIRYDTFNFYSPKFLLFLKKYLLSQGVTFVRATLKNVTDAPGAASVRTPSVVFNCTGVLAPQLNDVTDPKRNYPVRGHVLAVRAPWIHTNYGFRDEGHPPTYVIPRLHSNGRVILGGYYDAGDSTAGTSYEQTQSILARTTRKMPELLKHGPLEVLDERAGLRPGRDGGPRIEREYINGLPVIHNYGAGGTGFQCGLAMAQDAIDLYLDNKSKL